MSKGTLNTVTLSRAERKGLGNTLLTKGAPIFHPEMCVPTHTFGIERGLGVSRIHLKRKNILWRVGTKLRNFNLYCSRSNLPNLISHPPQKRCLLNLESASKAHISRRNPGMQPTLWTQCCGCNPWLRLGWMPWLWGTVEHLRIFEGMQSNSVEFPRVVQKALVSASAPLSHHWERPPKYPLPQKGTSPFKQGWYKTRYLSNMPIFQKKRNKKHLWLCKRLVLVITRTLVFSILWQVRHDAVASIPTAR